MHKVAIVADSIACLTPELVQRYDIDIIPINFYAEGKLYRDWVDITPSEAYEKFLKDPDSFKTSASSPEDCLQAFRQAAGKAPNLLCITVSQHISSVYNFARESRELMLEERPDLTIELLDSRTATPAEGMVVLVAARAAEEGKELPEVIRAAEKVRDRVNAIVLLDTIRHVYRSGRIPKIASKIGSVLNIRPIFTVSETVHFAAMVRNRQQGIKRVLEMMRQKVGDQPIHMAVMHAYALDEAERLKERITAEFNCVETWLAEFSPVMGYACGTGTVGVAFYTEEEE
jgi:DegV family protein with EDD domain